MQSLVCIEWPSLKTASAGTTKARLRLKECPVESPRFMRWLNLVKVRHNVQELPASVKYNSKLGSHIKLNAYIGLYMFNTLAAKAYNAVCHAGDRK